MSSDRGLADHSVLTLPNLIATRATSPVEVLEAHLTEIVTLASEKARTAVGQAVMRGDLIGLLHGFPLVIKDITETAGIRTPMPRRFTATMCRRRCGGRGPAEAGLVVVSKAREALRPFWYQGQTRRGGYKALTSCYPGKRPG